MAKSKKVPIRDLSRIPPTEEELKDLESSFVAMTHPIVTAVLGAAMLEHELDVILRPRFHRKDNATWARITGETGPLGSLGQKIQAAHAFGIFDETVMRAMNKVKDIRNAFAHSRKPITFKHETICEELRTISLPSSRKSRIFRDLNRIRVTQKTHPEEAYVGLCFVTMAVLERYKYRLVKGRLGKLKRKTAAINPYAQALLGSFQAGLIGSQSPLRNSLHGLDSTPPNYLGVLSLLDPKSESDGGSKDK